MDMVVSRNKGRTPVSQQAGRNLHLLAVAERLFLDKGYHHVSLALVASSAGVATRTVYTCFGSKRALLELILERRREASALELAALAAERLLPAQLLHRLAEHAFRHELSPCLELLHADLLAERAPGTHARRGWGDKNRWRALLEHALEPASPAYADVFVACLMRERDTIVMLRDGDCSRAETIDASARRALAHFLELVPNLAPLSS